MGRDCWGKPWSEQDFCERYDSLHGTHFADANKERGKAEGCTRSCCQPKEPEGS